jgi:threonine aldolase
MLDALAQAAKGTSASYGEDAITVRVKTRFTKVFEHELEIYPVITGTAANALALASIVPPHGAILCHEASHIAVDECGAPEFFTHGARLVPIKGAHGKIEPRALEAALAHYDRGSVHQVLPKAVSIAEASERGTVYSPREIGALAEIARKSGMRLHMDGARFANAVASLGCSPADLSWRAGVDVLSFGATKGGAFGAEAVIFFNPADVTDFAYRRKKSGHLLSKLRFVSAQLEAYLEEERWLVRAARANASAVKLATALGKTEAAEIAEAVEANIVLAWLTDETVARLRQRGARFYDWEARSDNRTLVRLVTSFATPESDIDQFVRIVQEAD